MSKILFVLTKHFPFGTAEQYLVDEVPFLAGQFEKVVFIPAELFGNKMKERLLPSNCEVLLLNEEAKNIRSKKRFGELFSVFIAEWIRCRKKSWFWKERFRYKSVLLYQSHLAGVFGEILEKRFRGKEKVFYSYWIHNCAIMLGLMKRRGYISGFICRGHSIDLYEWDWVLTRYIKILPFYHFIIRSATRIFPISEHGEKYLASRFPQMKSKFTASHLGVADEGTNPYAKQEVLTIVSCSNFSENKRVTKIAEVMLNLKSRTHWVHFGEGPGKDKVQEIISKYPAHVTADMKGFVPNDELRDYYRKNTVHLFINLSEAEGVPVSLMEAISFGIPVLASDVYGNPEVANQKTGFSVSGEMDPGKIADIIDRFVADEANMKEKRRSAREFYLGNFSASLNYKHFAEELVRLY